MTLSKLVQDRLEKQKEVHTKSVQMWREIQAEMVAFCKAENTPRGYTIELGKGYLCYMTYHNAGIVSVCVNTENKVLVDKKEIKSVVLGLGAIADAIVKRTREIDIQLRMRKVW